MLPKPSSTSTRSALLAACVVLVSCTIVHADPCDGVVCDDGNGCTTDTCDPATGFCIYTPINCDDGNACTIDGCDPTGNCFHLPIDCDDHDVCTIDACDPTGQCVHTQLVCDDGNACTDDTCESPGGCIYVPDDSNPCDDNNPATNDHCSNGVCIGTPIDPVLGQRCSDFSEGISFWAGSVASVSVASGGPNGNYLKVVDQSSGGESMAYNALLYRGNWSDLAAHCGRLEFKVRIFDDARPTGSHHIPPAILHDPSIITIGRGSPAAPSAKATFAGNASKISENTGSFRQVSIPLGPLAATPPPGWSLYPSSMSWSSFLSHIDFIKLPVELTSGHETWGWDDICLQPGNCPCARFSQNNVEGPVWAVCTPPTNSVTFTVVNASGVSLSSLTFSDPRITPHVLTLNPQLPNGQGRTVPINISGQFTAGSHSFDVVFGDGSGVPVCTQQLIVNFPPCDCVRAQYVARCADPDTDLQLSLTNLAAGPVFHVSFVSPPEAVVTPVAMTLATPIQPLSTANVGHVTFSPGTYGESVCPRIVLQDQNLAEYCSEVVCFDMPDCAFAEPDDAVSALLLSRSGGSMVLHWSPSPVAAAYEVVEGGLGPLRSSGGSFVAAAPACVGTVTETSLDIAEAPPASGDTFWYLVRAVDFTGEGLSYDEADSSLQTHPRDDGIVSSADCP